MSDKLEKCVHSVVFNVSKFISNKEHLLTALIFCFHLKKTVLNHINYFEKLMVNMLHRKIRVNDSFDVSKVVSSIQDKKENKEHGKSQKNSKMWNCNHCWTKMIRKHKNNPPSNYVLLNKLFPIGYERFERFRRPIDGCHMSWTTDKWKTQKHMRYFVRSVVQKEVIFSKYSYSG